MIRRSTLREVLLPTGSVGIALLISLGVIGLVGHSPVAGLDALLFGAFGGSAQISDTFSTAIPLILVALGWIVAFSSGRLSIGFTGQIVVGGIAATAVGVQVGGLTQAVHLPLAVAAGALAGAAWAGISAYLWARRGVNEIISTLLLNFIAIQLLAWLLQGPLQEPAKALPTSDVLPDSVRWPSLVENTALTWAVLLVVVCVALVAILPRTTFGKDLRMTGLNPEASRYAGIATTRTAVLGLIISGALGGVAGTCVMLGSDLTSLTYGFQGNYGFEGIVVALLARNHPVGCVVAGIFFAALIEGGRYMEATVGISADLVLITQGIVILLVTAPEFLRERRSRTSDPGAPPPAGTTEPVAPNAVEEGV
ncbi:MAG: sugar transporter permease [Solirubrobacterales bacterium]|nr:sugar transporter permease [Solirubrobacterales bacterium]